MLRFVNIRCFVLAALIALATLGGTTGEARATTYGAPCYYKWVVRYQWRTVPYHVAIIKYDHCGRPYKHYITKYRRIYVPVKKRVKVCY